MARKNENSPYERTLRRAEKSMIEFAVQQAGSLRAAAPILGVSISFLISRAKQLGIKSKRHEEAIKRKDAKKRTVKPKKKTVKPRTRTAKQSVLVEDSPPDNVVLLVQPEPADGNDDLDDFDASNADADNDLNTDDDLDANDADDADNVDEFLDTDEEDE